MEKTFYEVVLEITPPEHIEKACQVVNRQNVFPGFRKGKTPIPRIIALSKTTPSLQKKVCAELAASAFPEEKPDDVLATKFDVTDERVPGYLAAYIAKDHEFPYSIDEILQIFAPKPLIEENDSSNTPAKELPKSETIIENNAAQDEQHEHDDDVADDEISDASSIGSQTANVTEVAIQTNLSHIGITKGIAAKHDGGVKMQYLGNIQVVPSEYGSFSFYNFYPIAIIETDGKVRMLDYYERKELFPEKGNINIYSATRNDDHLADIFSHGDLVILDITEDILLVNRKANNELNITNKKIEIGSLEARKAIHFPDEFGLYPIIDYNDAAAALSEDRIIRIAQHEVEGQYDESVMIRMGANEYVGPFALVSDQNTNTYYINPQAKKNNYLFNVYHGDNSIDCFFNIQRPDGAYHGAPMMDIQFVNLNEMRGELRDFIPQDALVQELSSILAAKDDDATSASIESAFAGIELPNNIAAARRERLVNIFSQIGSLEGLVESVSKAISNLLVHAANEDRDHFDSVFMTLAEDPKFMLKIQRHRRIAEAIKVKEGELERLQTDYEEMLKRHEETEQQLETKQTALLTDSIQAKQAKLTEVEEKLAARLQALALVDDIQKLQVAKGIEEALLGRAKKEHEEVRGQTQTILETFRNDVKEPMAQIAHVVLNSEIEAIVSDAADKALHRKAQRVDRPALLLTKQLAEHCDSSIVSENILDTLYNRILLHRSYTRNEIINLMICLTQGFLTVFSGAPGTGKTSVCSIIAHALGLDKKVSVAIKSESDDETVEHSLERYVVVPVERGWSSKRDFVGYYNPLTKSFDKANSAIYQALEVSDIEAGMDEASCVPPSIIMLDEANLSPMEYYWADFMGVCDDTNRNTAINLSENDRFRVSDSLRFMATINNDHTTENLSPRLIDRAWVISLPQPSSPRITRFDEYYDPIPMSILHKAFDVEGDTISLDTVTESILKEVFELCREKLNTNVSPRAELAIRKYCKVGSGLFESSRSGVDGPIVAIDYAIAQKILPKVQGSGSAYKKKLEEFNEVLVRNNLLKSSEMLIRIIQRGDRNMQYYQYFA